MEKQLSEALNSYSFTLISSSSNTIVCVVHDKKDHSWAFVRLTTWLVWQSRTLWGKPVVNSTPTPYTLSSPLRILLPS